MIILAFLLVGAVCQDVKQENCGKSCHEDLWVLGKRRTGTRPFLMGQKTRIRHDRRTSTPRPSTQSPLAATWNYPTQPSYEVHRQLGSHQILVHYVTYLAHKSVRSCFNEDTLIWSSWAPTKLPEMSACPIVRTSTGRQHRPTAHEHSSSFPRPQIQHVVLDATESLMHVPD